MLHLSGFDEAVTANSFLEVHPDVTQALNSGLPVVALESSVISHGLPAPDNLDTAQELEQILRNQNVQPATIALIKGKIKVGLTEQEFELLASQNNQHRKISRRDIAGAIACHVSGGTTVAATMLIAHLAGISMMATGGIGGVHRNAEKTFDVSADLQELSRTPVAVVCSGPKAILDLPKTRECLETHGVPVIGYDTEYLPAFYHSESDLKVDFSVENAEQAAQVIHAQYSLGLSTGLLICNPIPPQYDIPMDETEPKIQEAIYHANKQGINGKALTPFLLKHLFEHHGSELLIANIALLKSNTLLAAQIACHLSTILGVCGDADRR